MLKIAIIGNGANTQKYGDFIDTFDEVVRINGGAMARALAENKEYVGSKITLAVLNNWNFVTNIPTHPDVLEAHEDAISADTPIVYSRKDIIVRNASELTNGIPNEFFGKVPKNTLFGITKDVYDYIDALYGYKHPTSGLKILFYFLKNGAEEIALFNFGFTGVHFFDSNWRDIMTDKKFEAIHHNGKKEREIIEDLQKKGLVKIYE